MYVIFDNIQRGEEYSRTQLAEIWGYKSYHAIARGVVTPRDDNKIILFVTECNTESQHNYNNQLTGDNLAWEGPTDHYAERRMLDALETGDEIHIFHRKRYDADFTYLGQATVAASTLSASISSRFKLRIVRAAQAQSPPHRSRERL